MGVDRQQRDSDPIRRAIVLLDAFDRDTGLPLVQHDWLVVDDAQAVAHVGVEAGSKGAPAWIDTRVPRVSRRIQRHHVGRSRVTVAPEDVEIRKPC